MNIARIMIMWNSAANGGGVKVVEFPDAKGNFNNDRSYWKSTGACDVRWRQISDPERVYALFKLFYQMTVRDGVAAADVHREFSKIDEFAEAIVGSMFPHDYLEALDRMTSRHEGARGA